MKKFLIKNSGLIGIGLLAGAVNGFFGGGAGLVLVPLLKHAVHVEAKCAHATSVAVTFVLSIATFAVYLFGGAFAKLENIWVFVIASTVGGLLGGFALKKIPKKALKIIFSLFLVYSGVRMIIG